MRTIKELVNNEKKVYIFLRSRAIRCRFMSDAQGEGIKYGDNVQAAERQAEEVMRLLPDGTICFLGFAGRMCFRYSTEPMIRINYKKYIDNSDDYLIDQKDLKDCIDHIK